MIGTTLYVALIPACAGASLLGFAAAHRRTSALEAAGRGAARVCLALALVTWLLRWRAADHLPLFGTYESALSLALAVLVAAPLAERAWGSFLVWPVSTALAAALLAHGLGYDASIFPLTISERSWVVEAHAILAWVAYGGLAANAAVALSVLWREETPAARRGLAFTLGLGFLLHSAMLASGSFYKFLLFGSAWSFDPIETLGLVVWVSYGTLLHLHRLAGWDGRRLAGWCLSLFVLLTVSYRAIVYFPAWSTYHIFDMDLRMHVTPSETRPVGGGR